MIKLLLSEIVVLVLIIVIATILNKVLDNQPITIKATIGKWFSFEATFQPHISE